MHLLTPPTPPTSTTATRRRRAFRAATSTSLVEPLEPRTLLTATPTLFTLTGNGLPIANGDKSPDAADATFLGNVAPGKTSPLSSSFKILASPGLAFPVFPAVTVSGKGSANFTVSQPTLEGDKAKFTVTYNPAGAKAGLNSALITLRTNDPAAPVFKFTVSANSAPSIDLVPTLGAVKLPPGDTIIPGITKKTQVPVTITNYGNDKVPAGAIDLNLFLRNKSTGEETLLSASSTAKLRNLGPGGAKGVLLPFTVPGTLASGTYKLVLKMNTIGALVETDLSNNTVFSSQILTIAQPKYNLAAEISGSTLPASALAGSKLAGGATVLITNSSNTPFAKNQKATLQLFLRDKSTGLDTLLSSTTLSLAKLAPGASANIALKVKKALAPAAGTYKLVAVVSVPNLTETKSSDNTHISSIKLTTT